ncbi:glycosyltransferase [Planococcus shenhongbingii]|uniref:Glycosyltransferase n=1 Tax=Planococcus shenhongbingii TaxID=3058398 RepID=A0ABT8NGB6_9BACL|nr:glycosyltransferase [Planococcus sp. N017]MDN7246931.1 glycosyltransferase [Planococcus sp. N017]
MDSTKLVSIIVPVYNAENYLHKSIDSLLNQTYPAIELILVNDGSIDSSGEICESYAKKDIRVKVIHQPNTGPSAARNRGMKEAGGEFLQFTDSDDFIDHRMTERLVQAIASESQLALCGYQKILTRGNRIIKSEVFRMPRNGTFSNEQFLKNFGELYQHYYIHFIWNKLYDAHLINESGLVFDTEVSWGEDLLFNLRYIEKCQNISLIPDALYYYIDSNASSITSQFRPNLYDNMQLMQGAVREFLQRNHAYTGKNKVLFENFYTSRVLTCFWNLFHPNSTLTPELTKQHIGEIIRNEWLHERACYFQAGNLEKKLIGSMIKRQSAGWLYRYYSLKSYVKKKSRPKEKKWV